MNNGEFRLMMSAVKQYYELGISQEEIAKKEYVSKSTVSRLIKKAVEMGYVEFKVNYVGDSVPMLEQQLKDEFGIECVVLPCYVEEYLIRLNDICAFAANDLAGMIRDGEGIGVTWGRTTEYLARNLVPPKKEKADVSISMLSGFVTGTIASMKATHIIEKFAEVYAAKGYVMPAPLLADSEETARVLLSDSNIKYVMDRCLEAQTVILTIGGRDLRNSRLTDFGTYSLSTYNQITSSGAEGDIAGRIFDIEGREIRTNISNRIISIRLDELKKKRNKIGIAVGKNKSRAILGAVRGGIINRLYTDELTAKAVLGEWKNIKKK